jgi:phosphatidylserine/phosphatidylglycerophosphate/cardiolipin synthase-like enzyme
MNAPKIEELLELSPNSLRALADAFSYGPLRTNLSAGLLAPFLGSKADRVAIVLKSLREQGCPPAVLSEVCEALHKAKVQAAEAERKLFLVLSGPDVPGIPVVDTATVARSLFVEARHEVLVCSFVVYPIPDFFTPLVEKFRDNSDFKVRFIVDVSHEKKTPDEPLPVVANRFRKRFLETCWSGDRPPELLHDPRPFSEDESLRGVQHSKIVMIDRCAALVTSANFTQAAQSRNIEAGFLTRDRHQVERIADYFDSLIQSELLVPID